jgi:hypothetical protein
MMGAHPLKVGLGPLICDLIRKSVFNAIATNGATMIHDFELAFAAHQKTWAMVWLMVLLGWLKRPAAF